MRYRRHLALACLPVALAIGAAGCGSEPPANAPADPGTTGHDMSKMKPGETMPTTPHDMSKMKPGETMPTTPHDMSKMKPGETMPPGY